MNRTRDQDEVVRKRDAELEAERVASDDKKLLDKEEFDPDACTLVPLTTIASN